MCEVTVEHAVLDAQLREAAKAGDARALAESYRLAADRVADDCAAGFFLTHAYVWSLVAGDDLITVRLEQALRKQGRLD